MTYPSWPAGLKSCITSSKSRNSVPGFITSEVQAGPAFTELVTDDTPVIYDLKFSFNRDNARAFRAWQVENDFNTYGGWFTIPIQIEEGVTTQTVMLLPPGFQMDGQANNVFSYSASVLVREEVSQDDLYPGGIIWAGSMNGCYTIQQAGEFLDRAMNQYWPEV